MSQRTAGSSEGDVQCGEGGREPEGVRAVTFVEPGALLVEQHSWETGNADSLFLKEQKIHLNSPALPSVQTSGELLSHRKFSNFYSA